MTLQSQDLAQNMKWTMEAVFVQKDSFKKAF